MLEAPPARRALAIDPAHQHLTVVGGKCCRVEAGLGNRLSNQLRAEFIEAMNRQIKWLVGFAAVWTAVLVTLVRIIP